MNTAGLAEATLDADNEVADLLVGQTIQFGERARVKLIAGASYVRIDGKISTDFSDFTFMRGAQSTMDSGNVTDKFSFEGWGPRVGIINRYRIMPYFGIVAGGFYAAYFGDHTSLSIESMSTHDGITESLTISEKRDSIIVPNLRGQVGLEDICPLNNARRSRVGIEAGYLIDHYNDLLTAFDGDTETLGFAGFYGTLFLAI